MPFTEKKLDDRTFEDLFLEAKRRIDGYLPGEWTDHNESDPGITLIQLFAWLTETMLFRLNQVPDERSFIAFLKLIGAAPQPALSATTVVEFQVAPGSGARRYAPHQLRLSAPGGEDEISFEADADVNLIGASLGVVLVEDRVNPAKISVTDANKIGKDSYSPFGTARISKRALWLGLDTRIITPTGVVPILPVPSDREKLQLYVRVPDDDRAPAPASTSLSPEVGAIQGDVTWEGYTASGTWETLDSSDGTRGFRRSGHVEVMLRGDLAPRVDIDDPDQQPRFWIRAVTEPLLEPEKRTIKYVAINAARVRQWQTFTDELLLPGSDGTANQIRTVRHPPLLIDEEHPPIVEVDEPDVGGGLKRVPWEMVDDLATKKLKSGVEPDEFPLRIFRVLDDRTGIQFGNGLQGRIPRRGPSNLHISYRSGGGKVGNLPAESLALAVSAPFVEGARQIEAASGGQDEESVDDAKKKAPARIKTLERAVTAADFVALAESKGAERAFALNRVNPMYPDVPATGAITLVVLPKLDVSAPMPNQEFLDAMADALEEHRVLTTELFVIAPEYRCVDVEVEVEVEQEFDITEVDTNATAAIREFMHPVRGGLDGSGWPLNGPIHYGELISVLLRVPKVRAVRDLILILDGVRQPKCTDVGLGARYGLIDVGQVTVSFALREVRR